MAGGIIAQLVASQPDVITVILKIEPRHLNDH